MAATRPVGTEGAAWGAGKTAFRVNARRAAEAKNHHPAAWRGGLRPVVAITGGPVASHRRQLHDAFNNFVCMMKVCECRGVLAHTCTHVRHRGCIHMMFVLARTLF